MDAHACMSRLTIILPIPHTFEIWHVRVSKSPRNALVVDWKQAFEFSCSSRPDVAVLVCKQWLQEAPDKETQQHRKEAHRDHTTFLTTDHDIRPRVDFKI